MGRQKVPKGPGHFKKPVGQPVVATVTVGTLLPKFSPGGCLQLPGL